MATNEPKYDVLWPLSRKAVKRTDAAKRLISSIERNISRICSCRVTCSQISRPSCMPI